MPLFKTKRDRALAAVAFLLVTALLLVLAAERGDRYFRTRREAAVYDAVLDAAADFGVSPAMILAVIRTESDFHAGARSEAGALGLMQLLPETFAFLRDERLEEELPDSAIFDPATNIRYGTYYLSYLFKRFGAWREALAAYNAGEGRVAAWLADSRYASAGHLTAIPFEETENYVTVTLTAYREYQDKYNFEE